MNWLSRPIRTFRSERLLELKQIGLSDKRIGELTGKSGLEMRALRKQLGVTPAIFQIDTLAGEFPSDTNYLYMTYNGHHNDVEPFCQMTAWLCSAPAPIALAPRLNSTGPA